MRQENAAVNRNDDAVKQYGELAIPDECYHRLRRFVDCENFNGARELIDASEPDIITPASISIALFALSHCSHKADCASWNSLKLKFLNHDARYLDVLVASLTSPEQAVKPYSMSIDDIFTGRVAIQLFEGDAAPVTRLICNLVPSSSLKVLMHLFRRLSDYSSCRACKRIPTVFLETATVLKLLVLEITARDLSRLDSSRCLYLLQAVADLEISSDLRQELPLDSLVDKIDSVMSPNLRGLDDFINFSEISIRLNKSPPKSIRKLKIFITSNAFKFPVEKICLLAGCVDFSDAGFKNVLDTIVNAKTIKTVSIRALFAVAKFFPQLTSKELSHRDLTGINADDCAMLIQHFPEIETESMSRHLLESIAQLKPKMVMRSLLSLSKVRSLNPFVTFIDEHINNCSHSDACIFGAALARSFSGDHKQVILISKIFKTLANHPLQNELRSILANEQLNYLIDPR